MQRPSYGWLGPGVIMAASGIGASDIVTATVSGAHHGLLLLWVVVVGAFCKFVLSEGVARWQFSTGTTLVEGWSQYLPRWVMLVFACYLVTWAVAVSGAVASGSGLAIENITHGVVPRTWGALAQVAVVFVLIWTARAERLKRIMKPLIVLMFVSIVICALLTFREPAAVARSLLVPTVPKGVSTFVLSLIGGIGGSLTLLSYGYLVRDDGLVEELNLRSMRLDLATAYGFTAIFGLAVMLIANRVFHAAGVTLTDGEAVPRMAGALAEFAGPAGFYIYSVGFWAAVLASLVGVWQTIPRIFADCYGLLRRLPAEKRRAATHIGTVPYRAALAFMALAAIPFIVVDRPLAVVVGFTVIGSLFIPFLAATLVYLNSRIPIRPRVGPNAMMTNIALGMIVVLFLLVGIAEILEKVGR